MSVTSTTPKNDNVTSSSSEQNDASNSETAENITAQPATATAVLENPGTAGAKDDSSSKQPQEDATNTESSKATEKAIVDTSQDDTAKDSENIINNNNEKDEKESNDKDEADASQAKQAPKEQEEATINENENDKKHKAPPASLPSKPIKRARTAYFIFTEEKRQQVQAEHAGEGVAAVAKIMGQMWGAMSDEEKAIYQQKAAEERERVAKELEAWKAAGGQIDDSAATAASSATTRDPNALIFPFGRIRKICKLDPEVRGMSKEAIMLITKCAELATAKLGMETVRVAQLQNRRKLLPEDVANVCSNREQFLFLKDDVKDLVKSMDFSTPSKQTTAAKKADAANEAAAVGSKPLTSYFGATKK